MDKTPAPIFRKQHPAIPSSAIPSSSPSFGTPIHPLKPFNVNAPKAAILPIILPPATLRPLAFRTFTKKHSLTLTSSALQELAAFIGRHCGSGWREEGLAERVLEEVARSWKNRNGGVIVEGASKELQEILKTLEGNMSGGKVVGQGRGLPRGDSMLGVDAEDAMNTRLGIRPALLNREDSNKSFGLSSLGVQEDDEDEDAANDPRAWLKVIDAFEQPRLVYNVDKKHFERYVAPSEKERRKGTLTRTTEIPPSPHCCRQLHIRRHSSATDTKSFTNAYSATSPSKHLPSLRPENATCSALFPTNSPSKSRPLPTSLAATVAITCSSANSFICPRAISPSAT